MSVFRKIIFILIMLLITVFIWMVSLVYLNQTHVELEGQIVGFDVEIKHTQVDPDMGLEGHEKSLADYAKSIEPNFNQKGLDGVLERIEKTLLIEPEVFHKLKNDAVLEWRKDKEDIFNEDVDFSDDIFDF